MKIFPIISRPIVFNNIQKKHEEKKLAPVIKKVVANARTNIVKKDVKTAERAFYGAILAMLKMLAGLKNTLHTSEVIKFSFNKEGRFDARKRALQRKEVLQTISEPISDKQMNLEELVAEYEREEDLRTLSYVPVSHSDIASWMFLLKNREDYKMRMNAIKEEHQNRTKAENFFEELKNKNRSDARFLRDVTFLQENAQKSDPEIDYQELYDKTKTLRHVVNTYNSQKRK